MNAGVSTATLELAVVRYDKETEAVDRYARARDAASPRGYGEGPRWTRDVGFVERHHNGRLLLRGTFAGHYLDVDEGDRVSQRDAGEGAAAGGLVGVLAGPPGIAVGLLLGGLIGANAGSPDEVEAEPGAFADRIREAVPRGSSAVVMIAAPEEVEELVGALGDQAAEVIRRPLSDDEAAAVQQALSSAPRTGG